MKCPASSVGLRGDLARGQGCSRHGVPGLTGTLPWSGDSLCRPRGLAGGQARLGSSGHPPRVVYYPGALYSEFLVTSLLAELAPPGPPLSGKEGPPRKSNRVTGFCSVPAPSPSLCFLPLASLVTHSPDSPWNPSLATHSPVSQGPRRSPPTPYAPWEAPPLPEALGSAPQGPSPSQSPCSLPRSSGAGGPCSVQGL